MSKKGKSARARALEVQRLNLAPPSPEEVLAARSWIGGEPEQGAWTAAQLAEWGILWPPKKGWRAELARRHAALDD